MYSINDTTATESNGDALVDQICDGVAIASALSQLWVYIFEHSFLYSTIWAIYFSDSGHFDEDWHSTILVPAHDNAYQRSSNMRRIWRQLHSYPPYDEQISAGYTSLDDDAIGEFWVALEIV